MSIIFVSLGSGVFLYVQKVGLVDEGENSSATVYSLHPGKDVAAAFLRKPPALFHLKENVPTLSSSQTPRQRRGLLSPAQTRLPSPLPLASRRLAARSCFSAARSCFSAAGSSDTSLFRSKKSVFLSTRLQPPCKAGDFVGVGGGPRAQRSICHLLDMLSTICRIEVDDTLSDQDKARARQWLLSGAARKTAVRDGDGEDYEDGESALEGLVFQNFSCAFCMKLPERPIIELFVQIKGQIRGFLYVLLQEHYKSWWNLFLGLSATGATSSKQEFQSQINVVQRAAAPSQEHAGVSTKNRWSWKRRELKQ